MATLLLIPLEDTVVFPTMDVTLPVDVGDEERVLLVPRHDGEYASVGTIARVTERIRLPGGARGAMFEGVARGIAGAAHTDARGRLVVEVTEHPDDVPIDGRTRDLEREYRATIEEIRAARRRRSHLRLAAPSPSPGALADTSATRPT
jgi:ATP-dependent Lon protease